MKRWIAAAAFAGSLLVCPLEAAAQNYEPGIKNGSLICGSFPSMFSFVAMQNLNNIGKRSLCRWKCVYRTASGQTHVNAGARNLAPYEQVGMNNTQKRIKGSLTKVAGSGSCVEAKHGRGG